MKVLLNICSKKIIGALASIIGGLLVFLCVYWLFRLDTWTERGIYIGASIFGDAANLLI